MANTLKSIIAGILATPIILVFTIGVGMVCGVNLHFLLISVIITNIVGIIINKDSSYFFNIGPGLVAFMYVMNESLGIESGFIQSFIVFAIPALVFAVMSFIPLKFPLIPKRAIAGLAFGIGVVIILKQLPHAFAYNSIQENLANVNQESSFFSKTDINNWIQLFLALLIPITAFIGLKFKKSHIALITTILFVIGLGYLLGYDKIPVNFGDLTFSESFKISWTFDLELIFSAILNGLTLSAIMLINFWGDFSILESDKKPEDDSLKKSLRTIGIGNLMSGIFGVMPANVSLVGSYIIKVFGGNKWITKVPIILFLVIIAIIKIPSFNIPMFAFAGLLIYVGIILIMRAWEMLKELHWIDYIFTFLIGLTIILTDYMIGFALAILYALIFFLVKRVMDENKEENSI